MVNSIFKPTTKKLFGIKLARRFDLRVVKLNPGGVGILLTLWQSMLLRKMGLATFT